MVKSRSMNQPIVKTHFVEFNLSDVLEQMGEDEVKSILSSFVCPLNKDVEYFCKYKAVEFSKRNFSKTYIVFWETDDESEKEFVGYYTIATKVMKVERSAVSNREAKKLREQGIFNEKDNTYTVPATLIGQLGKNYADGNNLLIDGADLLQLAIEKAKEVQRQIGGKFVYLECEEEKKLIQFYENNNFKVFGKRELDGDETNIRGKYLVQLFAML